jgi:hypothetical protein
VYWPCSERSRSQTEPIPPDSSSKVSNTLVSDLMVRKWSTVPISLSYITLVSETTGAGCGVLAVALVSLKQQLLDPSRKLVGAVLYNRDGCYNASKCTSVAW